MADDPGAGTRREVALVVRLTHAERAALHAAARASGHPQTAAWVRGLAVAAAAGVPAPTARKPVADSAALVVVAELRRIGNNLNQIAKAANLGEGADVSALAQVAAECRALREWAEAQ